MPTLLTDRLLNVATPATAFGEAVPDNVPPPGFVPIATVTADVSPVTRLPKASSTRTVTAGAIAAPAVASLGCTPHARLAAAVAVMLNALLVVPVSAPSAALSVYPVPVLLIDRLANVAKPATAFCVPVPDSV